MCTREVCRSVDPASQSAPSALNSHARPTAGLRLRERRRTSMTAPGMHARAPAMPFPGAHTLDGGCEVAEMVTAARWCRRGLAKSRTSL